MIDETVPESWRNVLEPVLTSTDGRRLAQWLHEEEAKGEVIYPPPGTRLRALELTALEQVKVVILGQDPYHGAGQATGLAFSVPPGVRLPPSLRNIFKELHTDLGLPMPASGDLTPWAQQGVLLLNTVLTVAEARAGSHAGIGWEAVTHACLQAVAARQLPSVFVLWGAHAQARASGLPALTTGRHLVIRSAHPSPLSASRGFFGSRPFSRANLFLKSNGRAEVDWRLT
ncbi:uracil-DNA glycosylase [Porphyrobacter sp. GA68]|uniref:uracil-DNA glycosylase n=1 Tax=Porphyrobacter sp. GA68 TaxID=2883480 RepID=UPI001D195C43|nr:uracil-DNA glycosylase [Porphyrobacter sp. GA68]